MFGRKKLGFIDKKKINDTVDLASKVLKVTYILLIGLSIYLVVLLFKETKLLNIILTILKLLAPLFIGIIIAWLFDPLVKILKKKGVPRVWGSIISYLILFLIIALIMGTLIPLLIDQVREFIKIAPNVFNSVKDWLSNGFKHLDKIGYIDSNSIKDQITTRVNDMAKNVTNNLPERIINVFSSTFSALGTIGLGLIIGFFILMAMDSKMSLLKYIPKKIRNTSLALIIDVNNSLRRYAEGALIDCTVVFILSSIGFWIVGLKAPFLFGFICGLTNIIPYLGPYLGGAPAAIVGLTQDPMIGILVIVVVVIVQTLEGNFLQPLIMSKTTKLHPVTIMLGLIVFGHFFGIIGMLLSTPILAVFKTIFQFYDKKYHIIKKDNETDEELISQIENTK